MAVKIGTHQLKRPVTPKLADPDAERVRIEHDAKIRELQDLVRKLAGV